MKTIILIITITIFANIDCYHTPKCKTWKEHKAKVTKLPTGGGIDKNYCKDILHLNNQYLIQDGWSRW